MMKRNAVISGHIVQNAASVTPSDSVDLATPATLGLYVGVSGDVAVHVRDGVAVTFVGVPVGFFPVKASRVLATGTTATDIVALY